MDSVKVAVLLLLQLQNLVGVLLVRSSTPRSILDSLLKCKHTETELRKLQCTLQCTRRSHKERASTASPRLFLQGQRTRRLQAIEGTQCLCLTYPKSGDSRHRDASAFAQRPSPITRKRRR